MKTREKIIDEKTISVVVKVWKNPSRVMRKLEHIMNSYLLII